VIEGGNRVTVVAIRGNRIRLGISAQDSVRVGRQEVHERMADWLELPTEPAAP
jgi:sRNA-binding carbon storage regulator CsrA